MEINKDYIYIQCINHSELNITLDTVRYFYAILYKHFKEIICNSCNCIDNKTNTGNYMWTKTLELDFTGLVGGFLYI